MAVPLSRDDHPLARDRPAPPASHFAAWRFARLLRADGRPAVA
jgi:hypothetical protein